MKCFEFVCAERDLMTPIKTIRQNVDLTLQFEQRTKII